MSHSTLALRVAAIGLVLASFIAIAWAFPAKGDVELNLSTPVATTTRSTASVLPEKKVQTKTEIIATAKKASVKASKNCEKYRQIIEQYDWPVKIAMAVCAAESRGGTNSVNNTDYHRSAKCYGSYGLMQVGCLWVKGMGLDSVEDLKDPHINIAVAYLIWKDRGSFRDWSTYNDGTYKLYLV